MKRGLKLLLRFFEQGAGLADSEYLPDQEGTEMQPPYRLVALGQVTSKHLPDEEGTKRPYLPRWRRQSGGAKKSSPRRVKASAYSRIV